MPWFLPLFVLGLLSWLMYGSIESYAAKHENPLWNRIPVLVRWLPVVQLFIMAIVRLQALLNRDTEHLEIARYFGEGSFSTSDLRLMITGDGGGELMALVVTIFAIQSNRLPSLSALELHLRQTFRVRMMLFTSFLLLFSAPILFPESAYYRPETFPTEPVAAMPSLEHVLPLVLLGGLIMFVGEMFAASSMFLGGKRVSSLVLKMRIKVVLLAALALIWLTSEVSHAGDWLANLPDRSRVLLVVIALHLAVCIGFNIQPAVGQNAELKHGVGKSKAMLVSGAVMAFIVLFITPWHVTAHGALGSGIGPVLYATWMTSAAVSMMVLVQFLPAIGFDAAPRPEIWWMKIVLTFSPLILVPFTQFAVFLVPAVWIALACGSVVPWYIESDVTSPKTSFVIYPLLTMSVACGFVPLYSSQPLLSALWFGLVPCAISCIGLSLHVKSLRQASA